MLRRIPVGQRADGVGNGILVLHIARSGIHRNPAGVCDRIASIRTAEQVFGLYRLILYLVIELELLRTGVAAGGQTDNRDILRRFADFYIYRSVEDRLNTVCDNAFGLIQILRVFRRVYPVAVRQSIER